MNSIEFNRLLNTVKSNERSLEKFYNYYFPRIVFYITCKYGRNFAEDVAQEFFMRVLERERVELVTNPTAWVLLKCDSIAKRKAGYDERNYIDTDEIVSKDAQTIKEELYGDLYYAVEKLDETDKKIVELYYWNGYHLKEIAKMLNINYDTVRQRHKRLLKKLEKYLSETHCKI